MIPNFKDKIAVIGAGLAGLTMAYRLHQKGYQVKVFEARSRVGGRVHSAWIKNLKGEYSIAELGGQNITDGGEAINLCSLAKELGIEVIAAKFEFKGAFYDGSQFYDRHKLLSLLNHNALFDQIALVKKSCFTMQEVLDQLFKEHPIQKRMLTYTLSAYEGLPPKFLSTQPHNLKTLEYMVLGGVSALTLRATLKGGNATLPLKLYDALKDRVSLQKVLKNVIYQSENEILLQFEDGTSELCNKLILAIPCSVYNDITFDPKIIDPSRLELIQSIQYGSNGKIILPIQCDDQQKNWVFTDSFGAFRNIDRNLLTLYFLQDNDMPLSSFEYYHKACFIVKNGFQNVTLNESNPQIPEDEQFKQYSSPLIKSWAIDPYAKGSYSAYGIRLQDKIDQKIDYHGIECKKIFSPINDKVFFVGEHATIIDEIGTMEAAVESAQRLANCF